MRNYQMSTKGMIFLAGLEDVSLSKYYDAVNVQTIGVGATESDIPDLKTWTWEYKLTIEQAISYFKKSLTKYVNAVNKALVVDVTQAQFDALVSICYNIGVTGLTKSTFMYNINNKVDSTLIRKAMMMWTSGGGKVLKGLVNRRTKEVALYIHAEYGTGLVNVFAVDPKTHRPIYSKNYSVDLEHLLAEKPVATKSPATPVLSGWESLWKTIQDIFK